MQKSKAICFKTSEEIVAMIKEVAAHEDRPVNNMLNQLVKEAHARMLQDKQQNDAA